MENWKQQLAYVIVIYNYNDISIFILKLIYIIRVYIYLIYLAIIVYCMFHIYFLLIRIVMCEKYIVFLKICLFHIKISIYINRLA